MKDRYAVFGNPVAHSKSPQIHSLFAQQTGQDMRYEALLAPLDGFEKSVRDFIAVGGCGANVTVPFKEEAFRLATQLTRRADMAGAANTLIFSEDEIVGDNTDGAGLVCDIETNLGYQIKHRRILLIGAGGAARGVMHQLIEKGPREMAVANRTEEKAKQLEVELRSELVNDDEPYRPVTSEELVSAFSFERLAGEQFDLIINATSTGLNNAALPLPDSIFAPGCLAYEMVYGRETPFMQQARRAKANVADGLGMLVEQAAEAFFVWRGARPDTAAVLATLRNT